MRVPLATRDFQLIDVARHHLRFVLAEVPEAAVGPRLRRRRAPPLIVDEMMTITHEAISSSVSRLVGWPRTALRWLHVQDLSP